MNTYSVFAYGREFKCRFFFDADNNVGTSGIDVYDVENKNKHIGEIYGLSIPSDDEDFEIVKEFEDAVCNWLEENFW